MRGRNDNAANPFSGVYQTDPHGKMASRRREKGEQPRGRLLGTRGGGKGCAGKPQNAHSTMEE